jgi:hypothetical protein
MMLLIRLADACRALRKLEGDEHHMRRLNRLIFTSVAGAVIWIIGAFFAASSIYATSPGFIAV